MDPGLLHPIRQFCLALRVQWWEAMATMVARALLPSKSGYKKEQIKCCGLFSELDSQTDTADKPAHSTFYTIPLESPEEPRELYIEVTDEQGHHVCNHTHKYNLDQSHLDHEVGICIADGTKWPIIFRRRFWIDFLEGKLPYLDLNFTAVYFPYEYNWYCGSIVSGYISVTNQFVEYLNNSMCR